MELILRELTRCVEKISENQLESFTNHVIEGMSRGPIVGIAAGRMGYSLRGFIMRLAHMGAEAHMIGDTSLPSVDSTSTVIVNSSSGKTPSLVGFVSSAQRLGATILTVTENPDSDIGLMSNLCLVTPRVESVQPMKTLNEQFSMLLFDCVTMRIMEASNISEGSMMGRHSVFE